MKKCEVCFAPFHYDCIGYDKIGDKETPYRCPYCRIMDSPPKENDDSDDQSDENTATGIDLEKIDSLNEMRVVAKLYRQQAARADEDREQQRQTMAQKFIELQQKADEASRRNAKANETRGKQMTELRNAMERMRQRLTQKNAATGEGKPADNHDAEIAARQEQLAKRAAELEKIHSEEMQRIEAELAELNGGDRRGQRRSYQETNDNGRLSRNASPNPSVRSQGSDYSETTALNMMAFDTRRSLQLKGCFQFSSADVRRRGSADNR